MNADARIGLVLATAEREARARRASWRRSIWLGRLLLALAVLGAWQFAAGRLVDESFSSSPVHVALAWWGMVEDGSLFQNAGVTLFEFVVGWSLGVLVAIALACALIWSRQGYRVVEPFLLALYGIPMVALGPLLLMWFGVGILAKIALAAQGAFTIVLLNAVAGMRAANPKTLDTLRLLGARPGASFRLLLFPTAAPYILASLRLTVATSMVGVVLGEFLGSVGGLGHAIQDSANYLDVDHMLAGVVTLAILTCFLQFLLFPLERWGSRHLSRHGGLSA